MGQGHHEQNPKVLIINPERLVIFLVMLIMYLDFRYIVRVLKIQPEILIIFLHSDAHHLSTVDSKENVSRVLNIHYTTRDAHHTLGYIYARIVTNSFL